MTECSRRPIPTVTLLRDRQPVLLTIANTLNMATALARQPSGCSAAALVLVTSAFTQTLSGYLFLSVVLCRGQPQALQGMHESH